MDGGLLDGRRSVDRGSATHAQWWTERVAWNSAARHAQWWRERVDGAPKKRANWRALGALEMEMETARGAEHLTCELRGAAHAVWGVCVQLGSWESW